MLALRNLDDRTRRLMVEEIESDVARGTLFVSPRLSNTGQQNYLTLLLEAVRWHDAAWLADELGRHGRLRPTETKRKPGGGYATARVPTAAAATVAAEGEFNRYYARAVCRRAIEDDVPSVIVYRARASRRPRPESERLVGAALDPHDLLADLRHHPGAETALGVPGGPNSGLSVRLPEPHTALSK